MINSIQSLRAIAAIYVVLFHTARKLDIENHFTHTGASGVDLFFIISGFVITHTLVKNTHINAGQFITRRIIRIVPLYWSLTIIFSLLLYFVPSAFQSYEFDANHTLASIFFIPQFVKPVVYTGWTLNYEMYFYLVFSGALAIAGSKAPKYLAIFLILSYAVGTICVDSTSAIIKLVTSELLVEFSMGIGCCYLYSKGLRLSFGMALFSIFLGAISFFVLSEQPRLFSFGLPWLLIFIGVVFSRDLLLNMRPLRFLGDASYSIYLVHVFTLPALHYVTRALAVDISFNTQLLFLFYLAAGTLSGVICYVVFERPLTNALRAYTSPPPTN